MCYEMPIVFQRSIFIFFNEINDALTFFNRRVYVSDGMSVLLEGVCALINYEAIAVH